MALVALVTCNQIPEPDVDEPLLVAALERAGIPARVLAWDDDAVDWSKPSLVVVRSTWNYHLRPQAFLAWAARQGDRLRNPLKIVEWNHHKEYLRELEAAGLRVVPTIWFRQGGSVPFGAVFAAKGWTDVVVKPTVSGGSYRTTRLKGPRFDDVLVQALVDAGDAMMQPYITSVETYGERSLVFIDGEITHAVRKSPRFVGQAEVVSEMVPIEDDERELAAAVLAFKRPIGSPLYARVDLVRDLEMRPMVSEVELIEPSLFLQQNPVALERFVTAIARELRKQT